MTTVKKEPIYSFDVSVGEGDKKQSYRIQVKKPTRSLLNDAELFNAVKYSEFVKMGLLTVQQVAKRQIDVGGVFTEEQQKMFASLQSQLFEKNEKLSRLLIVPDPSEEQSAQKNTLSTEIAILTNQISEFEVVRSSVYEKTADIRARNETIRWLTIALTRAAKVVEGSDELDFQPLCKGDDAKTRNASFEELEEAEDPLLLASFETAQNAVTFYYLLNVTDPVKLKEYMMNVAAAAKSEAALP